MSKIVTNYKNILSKIAFLKEEVQLKYKEPKLIAVSKTFPADKIQILIDQGHKIFGENKVQEAASKWVNLKDKNKQNEIELHLIGPLQSNKVKLALDIFDVIQTVDREKIALKINKFLKFDSLVTTKKFFVQVNIGNEKQKSGISEDLVKSFVNWCVNDLNINVIGLMCIPPISEDASTFFLRLRNICNELKLDHASMGMTNDFDVAIKYGATFIRVGSGILDKEVNK